MNTKSISKYTAKDLYELFSDLYIEKYNKEYESVWFIGNEMKGLKEGIDNYGASSMACAILNCIKANDKVVNIPYLIAGLKYYLVEYNPDIYWAVHKFGDEKIKKLWRKYLLLDAIWFPSATQKIELEDVVKRLKKYANEKIKASGKAPTKKKN